MKRKTGLSLVLLSIVLLAACTNNHKTEVNTNETQRSEISGTSDTTVKENANEINITYKQAVNEFRKKFVKSEITSVELQTSFGEYCYTVKGFDNDNEYKWKISAVSGSLKKVETEKLDADDLAESKQDILDFNNLMDLDKATEIAEKAVAAGTAEKWELDKDNNRTIWNVNVKTESGVYEVKMSGETGEVLKQELEND